MIITNLEKNTVINCNINYCNKITNCISNKNSIITTRSYNYSKKSKNSLNEIKYNKSTNTKSYFKNIK